MRGISGHSSCVDRQQQAVPFARRPQRVLNEVLVGRTHDQPYAGIAAGSHAYSGGKRRMRTLAPFRTTTAALVVRSHGAFQVMRLTIRAARRDATS